MVSNDNTKPKGELEGARERDFYKYYAPYQTVMSPLELAKSQPVASFDQALAAFAQLGALRINARRCIISFFDRQRQYVLAEATRSLSLHSNKAQAADDGLWLGSSVLDRQSMLCERTLELAEQRSGEDGDHVNFMPDVTKDEWYQKRSSNTRITPGLRFYAGMAIRSPEGYVIGTYSIFDEDSRETLSEDDVVFLKDMGKTVMLHLEMVRSKEEHTRTSQMVVGLGAFVEGKAGLTEEDTVPGEQATASITIADIDELRGATTNTSHNGSPAKRLKPESSRSESDLNPPPSEFSEQDSSGGSTTNTTSSVADLQAQMLSTNVKSTFSRAANIIRKAIDVEGMIFFDASVGTFGGMVKSSDPPVSVDFDPSTKTDSYFPLKMCPILGFATSNANSLGGHNTTLDISMTEGHLHTLLKRHSQGKIFNADPGEQHLVAIHPDSPGADEDFGEQIEPSEGQHQKSEKRDDVRREREEDLRKLREILPKARSIAFVPLWDDHRMRWFAGGLAWSNKPVRLLHKDSELSFLRAFANSIMASVAALDTAMADQSKADLLNSISHELRSPLHGILGSLECLEQTKLDPFQEGLIQTVDICGKTLLDTINHLLDFAKINNFSRKVSKKRDLEGISKNGDTEQASASQMLNLETDTHLSTITEEALETVFAGYESFSVSPSNGNSTHKYQRTQENGDPPDRKDVQIIVGIDPCKESGWYLRTEAGAWRRLVMNLAGNAIKYTTKGFVRVGLRARLLPLDKRGRERTRVTLTVTDSGKGMSKDYLNSRLFKPFAQEDPLHPGTGLGLSIVYQIVNNLGGEISVKSTLGEGTDIQVQITMLHSYSPSDLPDKNLAISEALERFSSSSASFIETESEMNLDLTEAEESREPGANPDQRFHIAFCKLFREWYEMKVNITNRVQDIGDARVVMTTADRLPDLEQDLLKVRQPVLVLCANHSEAQRAFMNNERLRKSIVIEFVAQPFGPRKIARALVGCSERLKDFKPEKYDTDSNEAASKENLAQAVLERDTELLTCSSVSAEDRMQVDSPKPSANRDSGPEPEPEVKSSEKKKLRMLLVDDNKINLQLLVRYCTAKKHDYVTAEDGVEAVAAFTRHGQDASTRFDFVMMDISMPRMDGLEATRRIRSFERTYGIPSTKVIALTGLASAEAQQEAFSSGVDMFLTKPVKLKGLGEIFNGEEGK